MQALRNQEEPGLVVLVHERARETFGVAPRSQMGSVQVDGPVGLCVIVRFLRFETDPDTVQQAARVSNEGGMRQDDGWTLVSDVCASEERRDVRIYVRRQIVSSASISLLSQTCGCQPGLTHDRPIGSVIMMSLVHRMQVRDLASLMSRRKVRFQGDSGRFRLRASRGRWRQVAEVGTYTVIEWRQSSSCASWLCAADEQVGEDTDTLPESGGSPHTE